MFVKGEALTCPDAEESQKEEQGVCVFLADIHFFFFFKTYIQHNTARTHARTSYVLTSFTRSLCTVSLALALTFDQATRTFDVGVVLLLLVVVVVVFLATATEDAAPPPPTIATNLLHLFDCPEASLVRSFTRFWGCCRRWKLFLSCCC